MFRFYFAINLLLVLKHLPVKTTEVLSGDLAADESIV